MQNLQIMDPSQQVQAPRINNKPSKLHHVEYIDVNDDGILEEVAIVKREANGTIHYIDIAPLHPIEKARLKNIVTSQHADKYPLWELMAQTKLENGMDALSFFHQSLIKVKRAPGSITTQYGGGLANIKAQSLDIKQPEGGYSDPSSAVPEKA